MVEAHPEQLALRVHEAARAWLRAGGDARALTPFRDVTRRSLARQLAPSAPELSQWVFRLCEERVVGEANDGARPTSEPVPWKIPALGIEVPHAQWRSLLSQWGASAETLPLVVAAFASAQRGMLAEAVRAQQTRAEVRVQLGVAPMTHAANAPVRAFAARIVHQQMARTGLSHGAAAVQLSELLSLKGRWPHTQPRGWVSEHLGLWITRSPERRRPVLPAQSASDDARLLRRVGEDFVMAVPLERAGFALAHTPDADKARAFGIALSASLSTEVFLRRTKMQSRPQAIELGREVGRGAAVSLALSDLSAEPEPRRAEEMLEAWCQGEPPAWRWWLAAKGEHARLASARACFTGLGLHARLVSLFDEDWWRNPRAPEYVMAWVHSPRSEPEADAQALADWLQAVERSIA